MSETNVMQSEMEQELLTVRTKYKPYFEMEQKYRKVKCEQMQMLYAAEKFLLVLIAIVSTELICSFIYNL